MNGKYTFLFFIVLHLNINLYSQNNFFSYGRVKVKEIDSIEKIFNSTVRKSKAEWKTFDQKNGKIVNYGKPKIYYREKNKILNQTDVIYFYLENDSLVRNISYGWLSPENAKLKDFSKMFVKTVKKISKELNLSAEGQGKLNIIMDDTVGDIPVETTERRVTWKYGDAKITILMIWTEKKYGAYVRTSIVWEQ